MVQFSRSDKGPVFIAVLSKCDRKINDKLGWFSNIVHEISSDHGNTCLLDCLGSVSMLILGYAINRMTEVRMWTTMYFKGWQQRRLKQEEVFPNASLLKNWESRHLPYNLGKIAKMYQA